MRALTAVCGLASHDYGAPLYRTNGGVWRRILTCRRCGAVSDTLATKAQLSSDL